MEATPIRFVLLYSTKPTTKPTTPTLFDRRQTILKSFSTPTSTVFKKLRDKAVTKPKALSKMSYLFSGLTPTKSKYQVRFILVLFPMRTL